MKKVIVKDLKGLDKETISKTLELLDGRNIKCGKTNGTKIGTETTPSADSVTASHASHFISPPVSAA